MKKIKNLALAGTLALSMMFGVIAHDATTSTSGSTSFPPGPTLNGGSTVSAMIVAAPAPTPNIIAVLI